MMNGFRIEKLRREHPVDGFTCGSTDLDRFLVRYAFTNQQANASQTYIAQHDTEIIGFYTLVVSEVAFADAPDRLKKGLARHPVPIMLLARMAVSSAWQGRKAGAGLVKDAMQRTLRAVDIAGIRAFAVHAKDDSSRRFYEHLEFFPSATDPLHLFRLIKDIRHMADGQALVDRATLRCNTVRPSLYDDACSQQCPRLLAIRVRVAKVANEVAAASNTICLRDAGTHGKHSAHSFKLDTG